MESLVALEPTGTAPASETCPGHVSTEAPSASETCPDHVSTEAPSASETCPDHVSTEAPSASDAEPAPEEAASETCPDEVSAPAAKEGSDAEPAPEEAALETCPDDPSAPAAEEGTLVCVTESSSHENSLADAVAQKIRPSEAEQQELREKVDKLLASVMGEGSESEEDQDWGRWRADGSHDSAPSAPVLEPARQALGARARPAPADRPATVRSGPHKLTVAETWKQLKEGNYKASSLPGMLATLAQETPTTRCESLRLCMSVRDIEVAHRLPDPPQSLHEAQEVICDMATQLMAARALLRLSLREYQHAQSLGHRFTSVKSDKGVKTEARKAKDKGDVAKLKQALQSAKDKKDQKHKHKERKERDLIDEIMRDLPASLASLSYKFAVRFRELGKQGKQGKFSNFLRGLPGVQVPDQLSNKSLVTKIHPAASASEAPHAPPGLWEMPLPRPQAGLPPDLMYGPPPGMAATDMVQKEEPAAKRGRGASPQKAPASKRARRFSVATRRLLDKALAPRRSSSARGSRSWEASV